MAHSGGFDMNEEDEAFEELSRRQGDWGLQGSRKHQIMRYVKNVEIKGTSMTLEALKKMYQLLLTEPHSPTVCTQLERIARKALAEHAMSEVQRLGQEIEQEPVAIKCMKEWIEYLKRKSDFGQHMKIPSEMSAGTCWELALELEQFINTTPPQHTWVGLTEQDLDYLCNLAYTGDEEFALAVQAKLMEKNA